MEEDRIIANFMLTSWMGATISIAPVQEIISLLSGLVAIGSGLFAIRYYYIKSKIK